MSKRKGYSPAKRLNRLAAATMKHVGILYVGGNNGKCRMVDLRTKLPFDPGYATAKTISEGRFKWSIFCAVFLRDDFGKDYMKALSVFSNEMTRQQDIAEQVNDIHQGMIKDINPKHLVNIGWIACPRGQDLDEDFAGKIFDNAKAWDFLAKWETA